MASKGQHKHGGVGGHGFPGTLTNQTGPAPAGKPGGGGSKASAAGKAFGGMNRPSSSQKNPGTAGTPKTGARMAAQKVNLSNKPPTKAPGRTKGGRAY